MSAPIELFGTDAVKTRCDWCIAELQDAVTFRVTFLRASQPSSKFVNVRLFSLIHINTLKHNLIKQRMWVRSIQIRHCLEGNGCNEKRGPGSRGMTKRGNYANPEKITAALIDSIDLWLRLWEGTCNWSCIVPLQEKNISESWTLYESVTRLNTMLVSNGIWPIFAWSRHKIILRSRYPLFQNPARPKAFKNSPSLRPLFISPFDSILFRIVILCLSSPFPVVPGIRL